MKVKSLLNTKCVYINTFHLFQQPSAPTMLSANTYIVRRDAGLVSVGGIEARFYGNELCFAVRQYNEEQKNSGEVKRSSSCEKSCLRRGSGMRVTTFRSIGIKITSQNPFCCTWSTTRELRLSTPTPPTTPPPSYQCLDCSADRCAVTNPIINNCRAGDKCYVLKLQRTTEVVTVKGCSSQMHYWGKDLSCDYKCKKNVKNDGYRYHSICVSCCAGNKCNSEDTSGSVRSTTTAALCFLPILVLLMMMLL